VSVTPIRFIPNGRDEQKDADVKRDPRKNLKKVEAKAREKSQAKMTRLEELGPKQRKVVTTQMADRKHAKTFQVGRDAETGRFIPVKEAKRRTKTAVVETITKK
jgi:hypothetical protein